MVAKKANGGEQPNGATNSVWNKPGNMSFAKKAAAANGREQNGNTFRTDSAISGNRFQGERTLQRWVPDASIPDNSLEANTNHSSGGWDQFAANEKLFGLKTDYDENIYTTKIDRSHPDYHKRVAQAERKAREIENSTSTNRHVMEERVRDNLTGNGLDEEAKYSGVMDFPPLGAPSAGRGDKYTPPARRAPTGVATTRGVPVDPAIISSQLARPGVPKQSGSYAKPEQAVPPQKAPTPKPETAPVSSPAPAAAPAAPVAATGASRGGGHDSPGFAPIPAQVVPKVNSSAAAVPQVTAEAPNASATVERDVVNAFKGFANEQRSQAEKIRQSKMKADKESKLRELKAFASTFKLERPLPSDLVPIMTKDPVKQRAIQETAKRQAEEAKREKEKAYAAKVESQTTVTIAPADAKVAQKQAPAPAPAVQANAPRATSNRAPNAPHNNYNNNQHFRQDRNMRPNQSQMHGGYQGPSVPASQRPNNRYGAHEPRQPPTGPADLSTPRRTSGAGVLPKLNPNSISFRPNANAFKPDNKASNVSTPRSELSEGPPVCQSKSGLLIKRKPGQKKTSKPIVSIMERLIADEPPPGKDYSYSGGIRPAFDTLPVWKQAEEEEPADSNMNLTYVKLFEKARFPAQPMTSPQPIPVHPQGPPHQYQLPLHLQQGAHMSQRPSPRQQPGHMNHHVMGQQQPFMGNDDHRMMPSHSAQSFASPRMTPMVAYAQGVPPVGMQQPVYMNQGAPQMAQFNRSYSGGGGQFVPQQQMGGPVMMGSPNGAFYGGPNMMGPGPVMMYPTGNPMGMGFPPQGGPPAQMPGPNGFPSPGARMAPMMTPSGSQQGQPPAFPMSPAMQYGQPIYAQQPPPHMQQQMRGYPQGGQFNQNQMPHFNQHNSGRPNGQYNKNYQNQHQQQNHGGPNHNQQNGTHPAASPNPVPSGPQRPSPEATETK